MVETKYKPIRHNHKAFLTKAKMRNGFQDAYRGLALEYEVVSEMLAAQARAGLTQEAVASLKGTSKATSHASRKSIH